MPSASSKSSFETKSPMLITGAAFGVSQYLAREFAGNGHPVVLVAQNLESLDEVVETIRGETSSPIYTLGCDLREAGAAREINQWLFNNGIMLGGLINVAGSGRIAPFSDIPVEEDIQLIRLNLEAALRLTKLLIPFFMQMGGGRILNVAPALSLKPGSKSATYEATVAFMESWSRELNDELAESHISVTFFRPQADFVVEAMHDSVWQGARDAASLDARQAYQATMDGRRSVSPASRRSSHPFPGMPARSNPAGNGPTTLNPTGLKSENSTST